MKLANGGASLILVGLIWGGASLIIGNGLMALGALVLVSLGVVVVGLFQDELEE